MSHEGQDLHRVWTAEQFYWALLDASVLPRGFMRPGVSDQRLGYLFEAELPTTIEHIHCVYTRVHGRRYLACGIERDRIESDHSLRDALSLGPDAVPDFLALPRLIDARPINLLTGCYEPAALRAQRRRWISESVVLFGLILVAILLGLSRRITLIRQSTEQVRQAQQSLFDDLYPVATAGRSSQPRALRLLAELRMLERTRGRAAQTTVVREPDAAYSLSLFLGQWPVGAPVLTESISVSPGSLTLTGRLPSVIRAEEFVAGFKLPDAWQSRQPQIAVVTDGVRLTWRLTPRDLPVGSPDGRPTLRGAH